MKKNLLIDLNTPACYFGVPISKRASNEHGQNDFFSSHGIPTTTRIPQMCCALPGRSQNQEFFVYGSIFMYELCTINLSRESARYPIMLAIHATKTLSHGYSWHDIQKYIGRCQRESRLAYLRRLRASSDPSSPWTLSRRFIRDRLEGYGLRAGLNNHRPMPIAFSM